MAASRHRTVERHGRTGATRVSARSRAGNPRNRAPTARLPFDRSIRSSSLSQAFPQEAHAPRQIHANRVVRKAGGCGNLRPRESFNQPHREGLAVCLGHRPDCSQSLESLCPCFGVRVYSGRDRQLVVRLLATAMVDCSAPGNRTDPSRKCCRLAKIRKPGPCLQKDFLNGIVRMIGPEPGEQDSVNGSGEASVQRCERFAVASRGEPYQLIDLDRQCVQNFLSSSRFSAISTLDISPFAATAAITAPPRFRTRAVTRGSSSNRRSDVK